MTEGPYIAEIAALVGDPARANILLALMAGQALTAGELAYSARVAPQTASAHLGKLVAGGLLALEKQGRHRYFRLASPEVAGMIESLMAVAIDGAPRHRPASRCDGALRQARTCYDHLAGRLGVALADTLLFRGHVVLDDDGGRITDDGALFFAQFGVNLTGAASQRRQLCRPCLDWSERRPHLGGAVGAAIAARCFNLGWVERVKGSRAVSITSAGHRGLSEGFDLAISDDLGIRRLPWRAQR